MFLNKLRKEREFSILLFSNGVHQHLANRNLQLRQFDFGMRQGFDIFRRIISRIHNYYQYELEILAIEDLFEYHNVSLFIPVVSYGAINKSDYETSTDGVPADLFHSVLKFLFRLFCSRFFRGLRLFCVRSRKYFLGALFLNSSPLGSLY